MLECLLADFDGVLVSQSERGGSGMCESVSMRPMSLNGSASAVPAAMSTNLMLLYPSGQLLSSLLLRSHRRKQ